MPPQNPTLSDVIEGAIESRLESVYTSEPGRVVSFDEDTCTVNVQPTIKRIYTKEDGTQVAASLPVIPNVPLIFPGSGADFGITFPINKGDYVLLVFCAVSLDAWKFSADRQIAPKNYRPHALSDAVAFPGLRTMVTAQRDPAAVVDENAMVLHGATIKLVNEAASKSVAHVPGVEAAIRGVLSNTAVATAIVGVGTGIPGAAVALTIALNAYFIANPISGADNVKVP